MPHATVAAFVGLTLLAGAWNLVAGSNGGGNLMSTLLASRALTPLGATLLIVICVSAGPWLFGTAVARTIVLSIAALPRLGPLPPVAALLASLATLVLTWWWGMPTSTTLSLVGALAGAAWAAGGTRAVHWGGLWTVVAGMALATAAGFAAGWLAGAAVQRLLRGAGSGADRWLRAAGYAASVLQGLGYGANDAEKAIGMLALAALWLHPSAVGLPVPAWAVVASSLTFGLGMAAGGWRIARTVGFRIVRVRLSDALAAQSAAAATVLAASLLGLPVSTGQTMTTAVVGAGASRRLSLPHWPTIQRLAATWLLTLPLSLALGGAFVYVGRWV